jgi:hypothetical protein
VETDGSRAKEIDDLAAMIEHELRFVDDLTGEGDRGIRLRWRERAERLSAVSADRPFLYRPGRLGRAIGLALVPVKSVLRRLMSWYVQPLAIDQRAFNTAVLRVVDELVERTNRELARMERSLDDLGARLEAVEGERSPRKP